MQTLTIQSVVAEDGVLKIEVPNLPPGPVKVTLTVGPSIMAGADDPPKWENLFGLGKDVWQGVDALQYIQDLRSDRENAP